MALGLGQTRSTGPIERFPAIARVRFECETIEPVRLPPYPGSAWRGLLGHSLRRTVCVTRQPTCEGCLLVGTCAYSVFFESPPSIPEHANRYTALPHPFALDVEVPTQQDVAEGDALRLGMTLIGPAIGLLPYLIQSMDQAGQRGLGSHAGLFALRTVTAEQGLGSGDWHPVFDAETRRYRGPIGVAPRRPGEAPAGAIQVHLQTPLRIKRRGRFVRATDFTPGDLLRNLFSRLASLAAFYGSSDEPFEWTGHVPCAAELNVIARDLAWIDWTRYSSRQRTSMEMGGIVGTLTLESPGIQALWPMLWLGQWTHLGKGTSFGLGRYRVRDAARALPPTAELRG